MTELSEALKINDYEYEQILRIFYYFNIFAGCIGSDACLSFNAKKREIGIIEVQTGANTTHGFYKEEVAFQKYPIKESSLDFINRIKSYLFEQLVKVYEEKVY